MCPIFHLKDHLHLYDDGMLPLNAFSEVIVHGLLLRDGASIPLTFHRGISREGELCEIPFGPDAVCRGIPPRLPSNLPPPGDEHLSIALGETLGTGRVGTVHQAILLSHEYDTKLPPLVIKISRHKLSESMEQEAWFYEELEHVQGIAVPLCYGFFQACVEEGTEVSTWNDDKSYTKHKRQGDPTLLSILLECLGERIPMYQSDYTIIQDDVYEVFNDMATLGIQHLDVRWNNILSVIHDPEQEPSGPLCPNHGRRHQWRVIDFDLTRKINGIREYTRKSYHSYLRRLFINAPKGRIIEPWE